MSDRRIASNDLTVWTYEWVPEGPRGHVRDIRLRWRKRGSTTRCAPFPSTIEAPSISRVSRSGRFRFSRTAR
jgi:hypothetical protein